MTKAQLLAELEKKENLLREWKGKYQTLFEESCDVVFSAERTGDLIEINPAGLRLFKYDSTEELLKTNLTRDLFVNSDDRSRFERHLLEEGHVTNMEIPMRRKNGDGIIVHVSANALRDESGSMVAYRGILKDVTEHRNLEQQLIQSQKMEAIGLMAGGVAHDFNNLLTVIVGNVQLGLLGTDRSHPHYDIFSKIHEEAKKASAITRRILAFSRRQVLQRKVINLVEQINNLSRMLSRLIGEDVELRIEFQEGLGYVYLDEAALDQVIMNLAVNAREAMPQGGVLTIQGRNVSLNDDFCCRFPFIKAGDYVELSVTDTGAGMEEWVLQRIFEPFFTTKEGGTGLGLAVIYGVVKQHKGYIIASSQVGKGSRFDIYLPVHLVEPVLNEHAEGAGETVPAGTETLLMAEDELEIRNMFKTFLEGIGYKVLLAKDGEEALKIFSAHRDQIDLVVLDAVMPKLSGPKVYAHMRAARPTLPCILLTGYSEEMIQKYSENGAVIPVLRKPVTFFEFGTKIREILDRPNS